MKIDYYRVLGVAPDASPEEIRLAWRALAREHHPDHHPQGGDSDGSSMARLNEAWATLGDPFLREAYDLGRIVREPRLVQDAVVAAARAELFGRGWTATVVSGSDVLFGGREPRVAVRLLRILNSTSLDAWLPSAGVLFAGGQIDCAVLLACRVLVQEEASLRVEAAAFPAVAVDLIESVAFGRLPESAAELFRPFLTPG